MTHSLEFVVPYYGDLDYLREAVLSVLRQSDPDWLLTVVEDGDQGTSVDEWLTGLQDPRIRHLRNARTLGVAKNFQRCLDVATRDFVVFLGCDDRLKPTYVETVRRAIAREPSASIVQPGVLVIDERGRPVTPMADRLKAQLTPRASDNLVLSGDRLFASLMVGNWTYFPSMVWHRQSLQAVGFRQDVVVTVDLVALTDLLLRDESLLVVKDKVFEYRRHGRSVSSLATVNAERFVEERWVLNQLAARARTKRWHRSHLAARLRLSSRAHAVVQFRAAVWKRDWAAARECLRHALGS